MIKQFIAVTLGIAVVQCCVTVAVARPSLFENVAAVPAPASSTNSFIPNLSPLLPQLPAPASGNTAPGLPQQTAAAQNEAPGMPVIASPTFASPVKMVTETPTGGNEAPGLPVIASPSFAPPENPAMETPTNVMDSLDDQYKLGPGDSIVYQVIEDQDAPTNLVVTDSGDLEVPYYGLVHAAGLTCQQLADEIKTLLQKNLYYRATVVIALAVENKNWVTGKVYVTGQVKNPGSYPIPSTENMTVSKAILAAGGFSDFSDQKHVRLIEQTYGGQQTFVVNVVDVWKGDLSKDLPVKPGDTVVVPAKLINY